MDKKFLCHLIMLLTFAAGILQADQSGKKKAENVNKTAGFPGKTYFNANNISTVFTIDGSSDNNAEERKCAFTFPRGSNQHIFYQSGLVWGAKVLNNPGDQSYRVGGSTYNHGQVGGRILDNEYPQDQNDSQVRMYRVRPDVKEPGIDLSRETIDEGATRDQILNQYLKDWEEWPAGLGAPYYDVDENGVYDPNVDVPGVKGADQTIWFVSNDLDEDATKKLYGSLPLGVEVQTTIWGYNREGELGNAIFRKYTLINKGGKVGMLSYKSDLDSVYFCMWSDPDLGDPDDDYIGCDTTLNLGYVYNGNGNDAQYKSTPPAAGFKLLQGPVVDGESSDKALFQGRYIQGKKNLPMTSFFFSVNGDPLYTDPEIGSYDGTLQFRNLFEGKLVPTGNPFTNPFNNGKETKFLLSGDPITHKGWIDAGPSDRRFGLVSGPFKMSLGDTQEIVVAQIAAGAATGISNIGALSLLKLYSEKIQEAYDCSFKNIMPPPNSAISIAELDKEIVLNWSGNTKIQEIEDYNQNGYKFQGYNVYQFENDSAGIEEGKVIITFDIADGVTNIIEPVYDPDAGMVLDKVIQKGSDSGLQRYFSIRTDALDKNQPLQNDKKYYFAVSPYFYNEEGIPSVIYSPITIYTVSPHYNPPASEDDILNSGELNADRIDHDGNSDAIIQVQVVDPSKLKGIDYAVVFKKQAFTFDSKWKPLSFNKKTGPHIDGAAVYGNKTNQYVIKLMVHFNSSEYPHCEGVEFTFPESVNILNGSLHNFNRLTNYQGLISGNMITFGGQETTKEGILDDEEIIDITVDSKDGSLPIAISYKMFNTTFSNFIENASGSISIESILSEFRVVNAWDLINEKTGEVILGNQTVINRIDMLDDYSFPLISASDPVVNGLQIKVGGSYDISQGFSSAFLFRGSGEPVDVHQDFPDTYDLNPGIALGNMTYFTNVETSLALDSSNQGRGTYNKNILKKDLELRFTGEWEANADSSLFTIKEGTGSMATIYDLSALDINTTGNHLGSHPLNPNSGSNEPFLIRIPFEVWNTTDNRQVNVLVRDRAQLLPGGSLPKPFYSWNPKNRMYFNIMETPYDDKNAINVNGPEMDSLTWSLVSWSSLFKKGDIVQIQYANPIELGKDVFRFSTKSSLIEIESDDVSVPKEYELSQNYPNPFNPATTINFAVPKAGNVKITIYDLLGRQVEVLTNQDYSVGTYKLSWNASRYSSGVYFYRMETSGFAKAKKMLLIK